MDRPIILWGVLWHQRNRLNALMEHLIYLGGLPVLFNTRREAREWSDKWCGYIRTREDLRREPHGWRMPRPVRVTIRRMK
jgi:hypothetical protein